MQQLIATLIERGHAYAAEDGSGDVYFDTRSWPAYGELTRQRIDDMEPAADSDTRGKRDSRDFALWKGHKPDEPESASWSSPWGPGRPGWHIECSAMSTALLGDEFDIHGGGLDLRFPHHENELAQSSAAGQPFARLWIHNGLVAVGDQKMSKSLGNFILADDLLRSAPALAIRYCLGSAHYRSSLEFQPGSLTEAAAAVERLHSFLVRAKRRLAGTRFEVEEPIAHVVPDEFADAMNDDLGVPAALAVLHEAVRRGNALLDAESLDEVADTTVAVESMMSVLGLLNEPNADDRDLEGLGAALDELVRQRIDSRNRARGAKQYDVADSIRDELKQAGIILSDDASGTQWSLDG